MTTKKITEIGVTFYKAGGHKHDGITSSLIDTSKYSIFDFDLSTATENGDTNREIRRQNNRNRFDQYVARFVTSQVLAPAGIVLPPNSVGGVNIGANEITANNIAANTITAAEIAANTITSDLLVTDFAVVNSTIRSNNFSYVANSNTNTGWAIYSNGNAIFNNGTFSGTIDVGGFDNDSFHVASNGSVWIGSGTFATGKVRIDAFGNTVLANGGFSAFTNGNVNISGSTVISGDLNVNGTVITLAPLGGGTVIVNGGMSTTSGATIDGDFWARSNVFMGFYNNNSSNPAISLIGLANSGAAAETIQFGRTLAVISRFVDPLTLAPSHANNQMLRLRNFGVTTTSGRSVAGISFIVGNTVTQRAGVWRYFGADNAFGAGNGEGDALIRIFALSYELSSIAYKKDVEYMPADSRYISVERIKKLKPARWSEKKVLQEGVQTARFKDVNERWMKSGRSTLIPKDHHIEFVDHKCTENDCIGDENKPCPLIEAGRNVYGLIAEDVAEVFPKAVGFSGDGKPMGISYPTITYALIETVQDLLDRVEYLESKIKELSS